MARSTFATCKWQLIGMSWWYLWLREIVHCALVQGWEAEVGAGETGGRTWMHSDRAWAWADGVWTWGAAT